MAVFGCLFCGERLYYHGEPEGKYPVEHYFCPLDKWRELEAENLPADSIEIEHDYPLDISWRCWRCGSFSFFSDGIHLSGVYVPKENFSAEPMQEPFEFGPFWDDILWFDITESDIHAAEVMEKFPGNRWLAKNENEMRLYSDEARTNCVAQFRRFPCQEKVTVATMSLDAFRKMLLRYDDEIDWFYQGVGYEFFKEKLDGGRLKIIVNRDFDNPRQVYSATIAEGADFTEDLIHAKIFPYGKSIAEIPAEIEL